jgi:Flp pilus assembly protein TadG
MARRFQVRRSTQRGSATIEFSFIALTLILVMFAGFELDRMLFVYTCLADAAKAGERYAIVHGSDRSGTGVDGASGPDNADQVVATVKYYTSQLMDPSKLTVNVTYPDGNNAAGSHVAVLVQYAYDPWTVLPLNVTLSATSQGIIAF